MALWGTERERKQREKSTAPADVVQTTTREHDWKQGGWASVSLWTDRKTGAASGRNTSGEERCVNCSYSFIFLCLYLWNLMFGKKILFLLALVWTTEFPNLSPFLVSCLLIFISGSRRENCFSLRISPSATVSLLCT